MFFNTTHRSPYGYCATEAYAKLCVFYDLLVNLRFLRVGGRGTVRVGRGWRRTTGSTRRSRKADSRGWGLGGFVAYAAAESAGLFERDGWAM